MKTTKETQFIHNPRTGSFTFYVGQQLEPYQTIVTIPKGTKVTNRTALGIDKNYHFVDSFEGIDRYYHHDLTYHGANVPKEFVQLGQMSYISGKKGYKCDIKSKRTR